MRFADVIGQYELKAKLARGAAGGRFGHALLFSGRSGHGALPLALAFAQYINCDAPVDGDSCGVCASCVKMSALAHPDLHFVFPVANTGKGSSNAKPVSDMFIKQWRELFAATRGYFSEADWYRAMNIENQQGIISRHEADEVIRKLSFKPFEDGYKVMIVWLPEKMRTEAANGLLKILEEPWEKTLFLMVSEQPAKLLPTIISRLQEVHVPGVDDEETAAYLKARGVEGDKAAHIVRLACGDLLEAARLTGEGSDAEEEYFDLFATLMRLSYNDRHMELLDWGDRVASLGREQQKRFLAYSMRMLRENYMMNTGMDGIAYIWGGELEFSKKFSPFIGHHNIEGLAAEIERTVAQIGQNGNPRIIFPHFALAVSKLIVRMQ